MNNADHILQLIKSSVTAADPNAVLILYGSYARGDYRESSDIDLLILVDKDKITPAEEDKLTFPLFSIGYRSGTLISPMVYTKKSWAHHRVTPFYENVNREGRVL